MTNNCFHLNFPMYKYDKQCKLVIIFIIRISVYFNSVLSQVQSSKAFNRIFC